jgi:hypothetical protein
VFQDALMSPAKKNGGPRPMGHLEGVTEDARVGECPRCRATVLRGLCNGVDTRLDLRVLTWAQEVELLRVNWPTYEVQVRVHGRVCWLVHRCTLTIKAKIMYGKGYPLVMAQHVCKREEGR